MASTMSGCLTDWSQPEGMEKPETNPSGNQHEIQADTTEGKVVVDFKLDIEDELEQSDPMIKPADQVEEEVISDAECTKMELPCQENMQQRSMNCKVTERIGHIHPE